MLLLSIVVVNALAVPRAAETSSLSLGPARRHARGPDVRARVGGPAPGRVPRRDDCSCSRRSPTTCSRASSRAASAIASRSSCSRPSSSSRGCRIARRPDPRGAAARGLAVRRVVRDAGAGARAAHRAGRSWVASSTSASGRSRWRLAGSAHAPGGRRTGSVPDPPSRPVAPDGARSPRSALVVVAGPDQDVVTVSLADRRL